MNLTHPDAQQNLKFVPKDRYNGLGLEEKIPGYVKHENDTMYE